MAQRQYSKLVPTPKKEKKSWGERKPTGSYVCAVCGEKILEKKGAERVRHEKRTFYISRQRTETYWTYRHKKCGVTKEETQNGRKDVND